MSQLIRNIFTTYLARVVMVASAFLLFPFIAGHVGLADYGIYLLFSSIAFFFNLDFGMGTSAIRYVAEAHARNDVSSLNRVASSIVGLFAVLGVSMAVVFAVSMTLLLPTFHIPADKDGLAQAMIGVVAVGSLVLGMPLTVFRNVLAGIQRYDVANAVILVQVAVRVGLIVGLVLAGFGVLAVALADAFATVLAGLLSLAACRRFIPELRLSPRLVSWRLLRSITPYSLQVFVMGTAAVVILQADNLIIGIFLPVAMVTLYTASYRIYQVCREVTGSLMTPLIGDATQSHTTGDRRRLQQLFLRGTKYANALLLLPAVPAIILAQPVLVLWAGERFGEVADVTQILLVSLLVNNNHLVALPVLMGTGRIKRYAMYHVTWATSNIILSVILVQEFGLVGIALGTAIPVILLEPLYIRTALRELDLSARDFIGPVLGKTFLPALLAALPCWWLAEVWDPTTFLDVLAVASLYAAVFCGGFAWAGLDAGERSRLAAFLRVGRRAKVRPA